MNFAFLDRGKQARSGPVDRSCHITQSSARSVPFQYAHVPGISDERFM